MTFKLIDIKNLQASDSRNIEFLSRLTALQKSTNSICDTLRKKNRK